MKVRVLTVSFVCVYRLDARSVDAKEENSKRDDTTLHHLSIGRLLQIVSAHRDAVEFVRETWSIERVELQPTRAARRLRDSPARHGKRVRRDEPSIPSEVFKQVAFTSRSVWILGYVRFPDEDSAGSGLYVCDSNARIYTLLLDPKPEYMDQLVLIKSWTLVDTGGEQNARQQFRHLFLEVHDPPIILRQSETVHGPPCRAELMRLLDAHYPTQEPPLYTGAKSWRAIQNGEPPSGPASTMELFRNEKKPKKKKVHAVCGRVVCVSPVSNQEDSSSCHFFVEVEYDRGEATIQHIVNIMFAGTQNLRWRVFLRPGQQVLITDLVKVFSRECGVFLLQTTSEENQSHIEHTQRGTQVFVWQDSGAPVRSIAPQTHPTGKCQSTRASSQCLPHCEGVVAGMLWNECLELHGDPGFVVCLFHFPHIDLGKVREGATVRILNAHVIRWPSPIGGKIVLGLCARSHFAIIKHAGLSGQSLKSPLASTKYRSHKKLSYFGDPHRQSLTLSVWVLELFEALVSKFSFGSGTHPASSHSAGTSFPHVRRREALRTVTAALHIDMDKVPVQNATLGSRFLTSHMDDAKSCSSVDSNVFRKQVPREHFVTINDLRKWAKLQMAKTIAGKTMEPGSSDDRVCIHVSAEDLKWCLLIGCVNGNIHGGDLEICDRTGSLPLVLRGGSQKLSLNLESCKNVYMIRQLELRVETYSSPESHQHPEQDADFLVCAVVCSISDLEIIPMGSSATKPPSEHIEDLSVLITHVGTVKRSLALSSDLLLSRPVYRHVHGIALPLGLEDSGRENVQQLPRRVELLISVDCPHWHVEKFGCYRFTGAILDGDQSVTSNRSTAPPTSVEEKSIISAMGVLASVLADKKTANICLEDVIHFVNDFDTPTSTMHYPALKLYRMEGGSRIQPLTFKSGDQNACTCSDHETCVRPPMDHKGFFDFFLYSQSISTSASVAEQINFHNEVLQLECEKVDIPMQTLVLCSLLQYFAHRAENVVHVTALLCHPLPDNQQQRGDSAGAKSIQSGSHCYGVEHGDIHKARLMSMIGVVADKRCYWVEKSHTSSSSGATEKRNHSAALSEDRCTRSRTHELMCLYRVRSLFSLDTIEIRINASKFGVQPNCQRHAIVEFSRLLGFVARSTYKVYMSWGSSSSVRELECASFTREIPSDAELYGAMQTSLLNDLYHSQFADRTLRRYIVRVVYVSYVVLKRKCRTCHQALHFEKRRACWVHQTALQNKKPPKRCSWHLVPHTDLRFGALTYASLNMRCVIDDGSAQAELFLENDVAWELLACSTGSRRRFEEIVSSNTAELSYFTGCSSSNFFSPSAFKDDEYYQNEFHSMILNAMHRLRSVVVLGQRFYSSSSKQQRSNSNSSAGGGAAEKEVVSVLTFGKDIQITTKTVANVQLEARRVDPLHVKSELRQRLARLHRPAR